MLPTLMLLPRDPHFAWLGALCMKVLFLIFFKLLGPRSRLFRGSKESLPCACCSPVGCSALPSGLFKAVCLQTTHRANKGPGGDVRGAAALCLGERQSGLQSKRTLIWTNTAVAGDLCQINSEAVLTWTASWAEVRAGAWSRNVRVVLLSWLQGHRCQGQGL